MSEKTRGRKAVFTDNSSIIQALNEIKTGSAKSRYLVGKLIAMGLVSAVTVRGEGRGRPKVTYQLTDDGKAMLI